MSRARTQSWTYDNWNEGWTMKQDAPQKRLTRNTIEGKLGGVCAGIGDYLGWDHTMVRIITILLIIFTVVPLIAYFILWVLMPKDPRAPYVREWRESQSIPKGQRTAPAGTAQSSTTYSDVRSKFTSLETRLEGLERSITSKEWKLNRDFRDLED